ncbi:MAG TPA: low molecular weight phosphotyrosine protein phosphatase [Gammaproteobacteria bacterium]|nr:low molecular weight phosphotyrosine protein phosphatase [Gammaproteobacteria bacterium]
MLKVLFVCMGNICRSPTAAGVFQRLVEQTGMHNMVEIDSAGTHAYHVGSAPDPRAQKAAYRRGVDLSTQRARRVAAEDFDYFDYILAMDADNMRHLREVCPPQAAHKLRLFMEFVPDPEVTDVPDPYYGNATGFERVLDLVELASENFLRHIRETHGSSYGR